MRLWPYDGKMVSVAEIARLEGVSNSAISARIARNGSPAKVKTWDGPGPCSKCGKRGHYAPTCGGVLVLLYGAGI